MAKSSFFSWRLPTRNYCISLTIRYIYRTFGMQLYWGGVDVHVYFQVPTWQIFGHITKKSFLHIFYNIPQTNWPIWMKFGRNIYHGCVHSFVKFQVHIFIIFGRIAQKTVFQIFSWQAITLLIFRLLGWFLVGKCVWLIHPILTL